MSLFDIDGCRQCGAHVWHAADYCDDYPNCGKSEAPAEQGKPQRIVAGRWSTKSGKFVHLLRQMANGQWCGFVEDCSLATAWLSDGVNVSGMSDYDLTESNYDRIMIMREVSAPSPVPVKELTERDLYTAYLLGCEDECIPEPKTFEQFMGTWRVK